MFNFITTVGGPYNQEYANKSVRMLRRNCSIPFIPYCVTDYVEGFDEEIRIISPAKKVRGWWNKMLTLSDKMPSGWILVMDVDLIINGDITYVIEYMMQANNRFSAYADAIHWENCKLSSSFMFFKSGELQDVYEKFIREYENIIDFKGGDQGWLNTQITNVTYVDELFPNLKRSLKFDLASRDDLSNRKLVLPADIETSIGIIDCHGNPKPQQLFELGWIPALRNWY